MDLRPSEIKEKLKTVCPFLSDGSGLINMTRGLLQRAQMENVSSF